ncbi:MAG: crossover junction endodeoxyribonuclease RuvC [Oscillospiraceae bacterium]|nr:crossover junction endodeoxyribonuclease RuvC [Oscillospiraceae bacterium]
MIILGIDPGIATVGFGVIDYCNTKFRFYDCGIVETAAGERVESRLNQVYDGICELIEQYHPNAVAVEELFFNSNQKTAVNVAQARGVILLASEKHGVPLFEYTPLQVKTAVVGYGRAEKHQVMEMTKLILSLPEIPKPDDAADALAIAICHAHCGMSKLSEYESINTARRTGGK